MDGLIILNKPLNITSAKALYRVRSITGQRKSGHAGTLDPAATGVLILCLGKATKLVESLMDLPKAYRATARLDVTSESFDSDRPLIAVDVPVPPDRECVEQTFNEFRGTFLQAPPRISAVKIGGVPSYKRARLADEVEPQPRPVTVYEMRVHNYDWARIEFEMTCGRGTYVRSVIRDVGLRLRTGGCLTSLVRTRVGPFAIDKTWTLEQLKDMELPEYLIPLERARELISEAIIR